MEMDPLFARCTPGRAQGTEAPPLRKNTAKNDIKVGLFNLPDPDNGRVESVGYV